MQRVHTSRPTFGRAPVSRRAAASARCSARNAVSDAQRAEAALELLPKRMSAALAGLAVAAAMVVVPLPAHAYFNYESPEQLAEEKREIEREEKMLEYILQQQANARAAKITAERATLQTELNKAESTLQKKLTEEQANLDAVIAKGDAQRAETIGAEQAVIAEREQQLVTAAALVEAKIDREEMLAKAEQVAAEQALEKTVTAATALVESIVPQATVAAVAAEPVEAVAATPATPASVQQVAATPSPTPVATPAPTAAIEAPAPTAPKAVAVQSSPASGTDADSINKAIDAFLSSF